MNTLSAKQKLEINFTTSKNVISASEDERASGCHVLEKSPKCFTVTEIITTKMHYV
jgi:hypothetical protein